MSALERRNPSSVFMGWRYFNAFCFTLMVLYALYLFLSDGDIFHIAQDQIISLQTNPEVNHYVPGLPMHYLFFLSLGMSGLFGALRAYKNLFGLSYERYKDEVFLINVILSNDISSPSPPPTKTVVTTSSQAEKGSDDTLLTKMQAVCELARVDSSLLGSVIVLFLSKSFSYAMTVFVFLVFSFTFNDLIDFLSGKDVDCHPNRALPSRRLSSLVAVVISGFSLTTGLLLSVTINASVLAICFVLSALYSVFFKYLIPSLATILWCAIITIITLWPHCPDPIIYLLFGCFFYAREVLLDYRDLDKDLKYCFSPSIAALLRDKTIEFSKLLVMGSVLLAVLGNNLILVFGTISACLSVTALQLRYQSPASLAAAMSLVLKLHFPIIMLAFI